MNSNTKAPFIVAAIFLLMLSLGVGINSASASTGGGIDLVLGIDSSGSMSWNDPDNLRLQASINLVDNLAPGVDQVGVVSWDDGIDFVQPLTFNLGQVKSKINNVDSSGGTNLNQALSKVIYIMENGERLKSRKAIIFITNGHGTYTPAAENGPAKRAAELGYKIYAVGLRGQEEPVTSHLQDMANATGGDWFIAENAEALVPIIEAIGREIISPISIFPKPAKIGTLVIGPGHTVKRSISLYNPGDSTITVESVDPKDPSVELTKKDLGPWWEKIFGSWLSWIDQAEDIEPGEFDTYGFEIDTSGDPSGLVTKKVVFHMKEVPDKTVNLEYNVIAAPEVLEHYENIAKGYKELFENPEGMWEEIQEIFVSEINTCKEILDFGDHPEAYINALEHQKNSISNLWEVYNESAWWSQTHYMVGTSDIDIEPLIEGYGDVASYLGKAKDELEAGNRSDAVDYFKKATKKAGKMCRYYDTQKYPLRFYHAELTLEWWAFEDELQHQLEQYPVDKQIAKNMVEDVKKGLENFYDTLDQVRPAFISTNCPVDILLEDPDGLLIGKENLPPRTVYIEDDFDGDGENEDLLLIDESKPGKYTVLPQAEEGASPEATYSLSMTVNETGMALVENDSVSEIPENGFSTFVSGENIVPYLPVETKTIELSQGWNLFSQPLHPENNVAENIFADFDSFPTIYGWSTSGYRTINPGDNLRVGQGYWVYADVAENVTITGTPVENLTWSLDAGWNLAGLPSGVLPTTPGDIFGQVPTIYGWGPLGYDTLDTNDNFEIGQGYWIYSEQSENVPVT